jgi:AbrB family looped-hinge helix DNA binding protein
MHSGVKFWGAATVGVKGQIVIPAEAREKFDIKEGDKVILFSPANDQGKDSVTFIKAEVFESLMERVQSNVDEILQKTKDIKGEI